MSSLTARRREEFMTTLSEERAQAEAARRPLPSKFFKRSSGCACADFLYYSSSCVRGFACAYHPIGVSAAVLGRRLFISLSSPHTRLSTSSVEGLEADVVQRLR